MNFVLHFLQKKSFLEEAKTPLSVREVMTTLGFVENQMKLINRSNQLHMQSQKPPAAKPAGENAKLTEITTFEYFHEEEENMRSIEKKEEPIV